MLVGRTVLSDLDKVVVIFVRRFGVMVAVHGGVLVGGSGAVVVAHVASCGACCSPPCCDLSRFDCSLGVGSYHTLLLWLAAEWTLVCVYVTVDVAM